MAFELNQKNSRELGKKEAVGRENGANSRWKGRRGHAADSRLYSIRQFVAEAEKSEKH